MKKLLLSLFCLAMGAVSSAQSLDYITFRLADGTEQSLPVDGLKITFEEATLHAVAQEQSLNFSLQEMAQMFFSATPTGVESVEQMTDQVAIVNGRLVVKASADTEVCVFTLDGRQIQEEVLAHGVYLVKVNGRTYKLMSK